MRQTIILWIKKGRLFHLPHVLHERFNNWADHPRLVNPAPSRVIRGDFAGLLGRDSAGHVGVGSDELHDARGARQLVREGDDNDGGGEGGHGGRLSARLCLTIR